MYGQTGAAMREEFAALLTRHRVQHSLSGSSHEARADLGLLIREYRQSVLVWMSQAMQATNPLVFSNLRARQRSPFQSAGSPGPVMTAAIELARAIDVSKERSSARSAAIEDVSTPHSNALVEQWRRAARAAVLAEHDTSRESVARMTAAQAQALVGDIAALTQALIVLDRRYRRTPGWEPLAQSQRLGWAALAAALDVGLGQPDYAVDDLGWRPKSKVITGPARPGVQGVLQAEHNLAIRMRTMPTASNLRLVVDSQRLLSHDLVPFAARIDERMAERWRTRTETYTLLQQQLRDISGQLGKGALAVAEGANAVARARALPTDTIIEPRILAGIQLLFDRLDARVADIIESGIERRIFARRVTLPRLVEGSGQLIRPVRERFVPVTAANEIGVLRTVRGHLRPREAVTAFTPGSTRVDLHSSLVHRPGTSTDVPHT